MEPDINHIIESIDDNSKVDLEELLTELTYHEDWNVQLLAAVVKGLLIARKRDREQEQERKDMISGQVVKDKRY